MRYSAASHLTHTSDHAKSTSVVPEDSETDATAPPTTGALHAADMVQLQHFNRSILRFYVLLSDMREGGVVPRSTAELEAEVME